MRMSFESLYHSGDENAGWGNGDGIQNPNSAPLPPESQPTPDPTPQQAVAAK